MAAELGASGVVGPIGISAQTEVSGKIHPLGNAMPQHAVDLENDPMTGSLMYAIGVEGEMNTSVGYTWEILTYNFETQSFCFLLSCSP